MRAKVEHVFQVVSGNEAAVRIRESALSRTEKERTPLVCHLRFGQPVREPEETAAEPGLVAWARVPRLGRGEDIAESVTNLGLTAGSTEHKEVCSDRSRAYSECP